MEKVLYSLYRHGQEALSSFVGWIFVFLSSIILLIQSESWSFYVVAGAVFVDLLWGILAAIKLNKFLLSEAFKETVKKVGIYFFTLIGALVVEKIVAEGSFIVLKTIAVYISLCEFWSISANMLIVKPNMTFLKLFRKQLKGEIQSKVGNDVNIDEIFKDE